jgi:hypothetical protein
MSLPNMEVFTIILYQNMFQNPELFGTQVSLSPEQSTLFRTTALYCKSELL